MSDRLSQSSWSSFELGGIRWERQTRLRGAPRQADVSNDSNNRIPNEEIGGNSGNNEVENSRDSLEDFNAEIISNYSEPSEHFPREERSTIESLLRPAPLPSVQAENLDNINDELRFLHYFCEEPTAREINIRQRIAILSVSPHYLVFIPPIGKSSTLSEKKSRTQTLSISQSE